MQKKDKQINIAIEPIFLDLIRKVDNGNTAQYLRDLAIQDLHSRGMITPNIIKELMGLPIDEDNNTKTEERMQVS